MSVVIGTLCLNEMEWLPKLYKQHKDWPLMRKWVFVESADRMYAQANPEMVNEAGLSIDGTSEYLRQLAKDDDRVMYLPHGFSSHDNPALGKCESRQRYLDVANELKPTFVLALDADEFYIKTDQAKMAPLFKRFNNKSGFILQYRNIWRPESIIHEPLFQWEIVGEFWKVFVCKFWRWYPGISYLGNHNSPTYDGKLMNRNLLRLDSRKYFPQFIHMGFTSITKNRTAKNRYYVERGEGSTDHRGKYVQSRASFEGWQPGDALSNNDRIIRYNGPIPEVFQTEEVLKCDQE